MVPAPKKIHFFVAISEFTSLRTEFELHHMHYKMNAGGVIVLPVVLLHTVIVAKLVFEFSEI